jgi:hypothetical protein
MGSGASRIYNIVTLIFVLLTVIMIVFVISKMASPPVTPRAVAQLPPTLVIPTATATLSPTPTFPPTFTTTPTDTLTPTASSTPTETLAPTSTITDTPGPTDTPSMTPTPSVSPTPTPTETPTGPSPTPPPTLSPYLFDLRDNQVALTKNYANSAGCAWQGIAGQAFDQNGSPIPTGYRVHVFGADIDRFVDLGSNSLYGPGGWEMPVDNKINGKTYYVELQSPGGTSISPRITVTFASNCDQNLALVNFRQVRAK